MESMLNKLKSTVTNAASNAVSNAVSIASQVSNYLPGNPVTREYEATAHIASAGRGKSKLSFNKLSYYLLFTKIIFIGEDNFMHGF